MTFKELDAAVGCKGFDKECIDICRALNSLKGVHTYESCSGHLKERFAIYLHCTDFTSLAKLAFVFDLRYCGTKNPFTMRISAIDYPKVHTPPFSIDILSERPYRSFREMKEDMDTLIANINFRKEKRMEDFFKDGRKPIKD